MQRSESGQAEITKCPLWVETSRGSFGWKADIMR